ncbi:hypothetical protein Pint_17870 [Pistacia integerrima]|uniref:Uncharacterized protein n=1 Tax=Pistacia integerrima TaxID=434235 RepID=A0ACC0YZN9_9ROSI|nr:hypothetical protein Pint_17870 [Pistacia integerrima]
MGHKNLLRLSGCCLDTRTPILVFESVEYGTEIDETHIRGELAGTKGFVTPEYITTNDCNEKCDVYSFGVSLLVLLTGQRVFYPSEGEDFYLSDHVKKYFENDRLIEIVDPIIVGEELSPVKEQQLQAFTEFALKCVSESAEDRPTMVDIAKQIRKMYRSS